MNGYSYFEYFFRIARNVMEVIVILCIFTIGKKRKKLFPLKFIACLAIEMAVIGLLAYIYVLSAPTVFFIPCKITVFIIGYASLIIFGLCYEMSFSDSVSLLLSAVSTELITSNLLAVFGRNFFVVLPPLIADIMPEFLKPWSSLFLLAVLYLMFSPLYFLLWYFFIKEDERNFAIESKEMTVLSIFVVCLLQSLSGIIPLYAKESRNLEIICEMTMVICAFFVFFLRKKIIDSVSLKSENSVLEKLREEEEKRYNQLESNMNLIHIKCHDMKHILKKMDAAPDSQYIKELKEAVDSFENAISTGNRILDIILGEKNVYCIVKGIKFTCTGSGEFLNGLDSYDMYTLFGNALDNAIEAVEKCENPEKRSINLQLGVNGNWGYVDLMNYYEGEELKGGSLPKTSKGDSLYHGFGMKSIKATAEKYDGKISVSAEKGIFRLVILFPEER